MKKLKTVHKQNTAKGMIFPVILFVAMILIMLKGTLYFGNMNDRQNIDLMRQAIKRAAIQCYAIEGYYPSSISYLEENYGIYIDHDKYFIDYMNIASNIMPNIEVYERY